MVPLVDEMTFHVTTVDLSNDERVCSTELLNSKSDWCLVDENLLVPGMSPIVSVRVTYVPTYLPIIPDKDEAMDDALVVVGLHVGQLWFRTEPEDALPVMIDEYSLMCDCVGPDVVPANQDFVSADVCGDDRFSPGVRNDVSLHWRMDIDFQEMVNWECQFNGEDRVLAGGVFCAALYICGVCRSFRTETARSVIGNRI